ncbi:MAG: prepilin-type N-terminal cleavage/methylation domain-containing protein [Deltaproteobacteria bacterium]|nr:prepilin-type N-terminal cleavage/methylation domain-containing protein [Deltaproteobacteria bacterium]
MAARRVEREPSRGFTLVELMVVVAIVGILAAVAIPSFLGYIKDARLSEAIENVQSIMVAEQAYYNNHHQYTTALGWCPPTLPASILAKTAYETQLWPNCGADWNSFGWAPERPVAFRYRVFTSYDANGNPAFHPTGAVLPQPAGMSGAFGVNWAEHLASTDADADGVFDEMMPWVVVEAEGDTDYDEALVYIRTNSANNAVFRCDKDDNPPGPGHAATY